MSVSCTKTNLTNVWPRPNEDVLTEYQGRGKNSPTKDTFAQHLKRSTSQKECLRSEYLGNDPHVYVYFQFGLRCPSPRMCSTCMWSALAQLPALSANAWRRKVEAYTSVQVHMQEVAGVEQFQIGLLTCILVIFLLNALFKDLFQEIV